MFGKKCSLCGGQLLHGICQECGLDNNKTRMHQENDWAHDNMPTSHVHTKQEPHGGVTNKEFFSQIREDQKKLERESTYQRKNKTVKPTKSINNKETKKKNPIAIVVIVIIIFQLLGTVFGIIGSILGEVLDVFSEADAIFSEIIEPDDYVYEEEEWMSEEWEFEYPEYDDTVYPLLEEGDTTSMTLETGRYIVGVNIPEGTYSMTCEHGGRINISDSLNGVWVYNYLVEENVGETYEGVDLYKGAVLSLADSIITIYSENSDIDGMVGIPNPNTEGYEVELGTVIGEEVPEGVYDISIPAGEYGIVGISIAENGIVDEEINSFYYFMDNDVESENIRSYKNVVLTEGSIVGVSSEYGLDSGLTGIILTPSDMILSEDYEQINELYDIWY